MRRNENQQKTEKANEIPVICVAALIEQKEIAETEEEQHGADAIKKTNRNEQGEQAKCGPVNVEPISGPGMDPGEPGIFKQEMGINPPLRDPMIRPDPMHHPNHQKAKCDSEK